MQGGSDRVIALQPWMGETSVAWEPGWIWTVSSGISGYSLGLWHVSGSTVAMAV